MMTCHSVTHASVTSLFHRDAASHVIGDRGRRGRMSRDPQCIQGESDQTGARLVDDCNKNTLSNIRKSVQIC
jgi:hypothetical protein